MKEIEVVAAIIICKGNILCVQKGLNKFDYLSNKFEFPGGKMEGNETKAETIKREIWEELMMKIEPISEFCSIRHQYPDFKLIMHGMICECENPEFVMTEHISYKWLKKDELRSLDWAAADLPIVEKLITSTL
jgi:8-oxo-dGTP diphosphatase